MHCIFITRCYKATNIQTIKENLRDVFKGSKHTYVQVLMCDLTRGELLDLNTPEFLIDGLTVPLIVTKKTFRDKYNTKVVDDALSIGSDSLWIGRAKEETSVFVYILDDDNQITLDFLAALDACEDGDPDAVVFKVYGHPQWGDISILDHDAVGKIDWANMLIRLDVIKCLKVYTLGADSQKSDGLFFEKMKREGCTIKFLNQICGRYNALPKP